MVPAVPTVEPLSFIIIPVPDATTPVNPEPLPMKLVAVTLPLILIFPVPVISLLNKSKFPPSWGVRSSTTLPIPNAPPPADTVLYATSSTMSPTKHPTANTVVLPLVAVNSLSVNLIPFTNTSRKPIVYAKLNVVCPAEAVNVCLVLNDGNDSHATPLPVVFKY